MRPTKRESDCAFCGGVTELADGRVWSCPHCQAFYTPAVPHGVRPTDDPRTSAAAAEKVQAAVRDALIGIRLMVGRIATAQNKDAASLRLRLELANWIEGSKFRGNLYGLAAYTAAGRRTAYVLHPQGSEAVARGALEAYQTQLVEGGVS